jgi:hypothetical protein
MISFRVSLTAAVALLLSAAAHAEPENGFSFRDAGEHLDVLRGGKLLARYMYAHDTSSKERLEETYKPYLHVFDASGETLITKGPGGNFTHHRGIFVGWNKLQVGGKSYDRWHMTGGEQVHQKFTHQESSVEQASFTSLVHWNGSDAQPILVEERTFTFRSAPAPAYASIEVASKLQAVGGETKLDGDPEHAGVQFRAAAETKGDETVHTFPREQAVPKNDRDYPWMGQSYTLRGKRYSVAYLNHPANPREAITSAYRDYGRFGTFFRDTIPAGGERTIRVQFLITEGEMLPAEAIQKAWNEFAGAAEGVPPITVVPVKRPASP